MAQLHDLAQAMIAFDEGDPKRIQHFLKVYSFARLIGEGEGLDERTLFILETAAFVHDIGIRPAEEKYGDSNGKLQEKEGPAPAREMLEELGYDAEAVDRVCYLVAHHHTYTDVDGADYRILLEADALVNLYEYGSPLTAVRKSLENVFETETGSELCRTMFGIRE